jgi:hypothetical protein
MVVYFRVDYHRSIVKLKKLEGVKGARLESTRLSPSEFNLKPKKETARP